MVVFDDVHTKEIRVTDVKVSNTLTLSVLTDAQRNALTPVKGMLIYNATDNKLQIYNGTDWKEITSAE